MICPACGSTKVHRSRRKWYERPMTLIGVRPYRCHDCQHRFFSGKAHHHEDQSTSRGQSAKNSG